MTSDGIRQRRKSRYARRRSDALTDAMRILVMLVILGSLLTREEQGQAAPEPPVVAGAAVATAAVLGPALGPPARAGYACNRDD
jgi:hypothetical protein